MPTTVTEIRLCELDENGQVPADRLANAPGGGTGTVETVNGISPDGSGNVQLAGGSVTGALSSRLQTNTLQFGPNGATAQDGSYTRTNSTPQFVGDGSATTLGNVYTVLTGPGGAQGAYPFATSLSQTVDYCAVQAGLNYIGTFDHGTLVVAPGLYKMGNPNLGCISFPATSGVGQVGLVGQNPSYTWPGYGATTKLDWSGFSDATGAPHFTFAIDASQCRATLVGLAIQGPTRFGANSGRLPCALAGVRLSGEATVRDCSFETLSTAIGCGGGTSGGWANTTGFDHSFFSGNWTDNVGYSIHLLPGSNTTGDLRYDNNTWNANLASYAIAGSASSGLVGAKLSGNSMNGAVGVYMYDDGSGAGGLQCGGNSWTECSFEIAYNAAIFSQLYNQAGGVAATGWVNKSSFDYLPQGPTNVNGWGADVTVASSGFGGANPNQVTINDGNGVAWTKGMAYTGRGAPAGTTVTAVAGSWPWATAVLTLSNNLTVDPSASNTTLSAGISGAVGTLPVAALPAALSSGDEVMTVSGSHTQVWTITANAGISATSLSVSPQTANFTYPSGSAVMVSANIIQPQLGHIVAKQIDTISAPTFGDVTGPWPVFYTGTNGVQNCHCDDAPNALAGPQAGTELTGGGPAYGITWGIPGGNLLLGSGTLAAGVSCAAHDALMRDAAGQKLVLADGTRPTVGFAIQARSAAQNVTYYIEAAFSRYCAVNNKSTSLTIAAGDPLKIDAAHPGGVMTATNTGDVGYFGYLGGTPIAPSSSGNAAQVKCRG